MEPYKKRLSIVRKEIASKLKKQNQLSLRV